MARKRKEHYVDQKELRKELYECQLNILAYLTIQEYDEEVERRFQEWMGVSTLSNKQKNKNQRKRHREKFYTDVWNAYSVKVAATYCSPALQKMLIDIANGNAKRPNFRDYTFKDDFVQQAIMDLITKTWTKANLEGRSETTGELYSMLSYFTQACTNSFVTFIKNEAKQHDVEEKMMLEMGMMPSWSKQVDIDEERRIRHEKLMSDDYSS